MGSLREHRFELLRGPAPLLVGLIIDSALEAPVQALGLTHGAALVDIRQGAFGNGQALEPADFEAAATTAAVASLSSPAADGDWSTGNLNSAGLAALNLSGVTQLRLYFALDDDDALVLELTPAALSGS